MTRLSIIALFLCLPTIASAQWTTMLFQHQGAGSTSRYGGTVFSLGDQNGDGYDDFAVKADGNEPPGYQSDARLDFFYGGHPVPAYPYRSFRADSTVALSLVSAGPAGDLNGDGFIDWYIAMRWRGAADSQSIEIFYGGVGGSNTPDVVLPGTSHDRVSAMGDFNGDGYDDLYVHHGFARWGEAYFGGSPMDPEPDWVLHSPPEFPHQSELIEFGDLNGDGCADAWSSNYSPAMAFVYLGASQPDTIPAYTWLNYAVSRAKILPDINGDGSDDLLVWGDSTAIEVHYGRPVLSRLADTYIHYPSNSWALTGAGDLNADGYNDFMLFGTDDFWPHTVQLFMGCWWTNPDPVFELEGNSELLPLITAAGVGDINGDGVDDWAFGGYNGIARGTVKAYSGNPLAHVAVNDPPILPPAAFTVSAYPNPFNSVTTILYDMPAPGPVTISAFDLLGRRVALLNTGFLERGTHQLKFDAGGLPSGTYILRLESGERRLSRKVELVR